MNKQIVFEDNHLLVVNKLSSQIVQGDKTGDIPLNELFKEYLKAKYNKPGNVFCGVIHRIDRPVTGIVILAKTGKGLSRMNELFRNREVKKTYWAIVRGKPDVEKSTLVHYLKKNEKTNRSFVMKGEKEGGLKSELTYQVISAGDNYSLLEVEPLTGRHHQIRVQLSNAGWPIVGDVKYGDKRSNDDKSICLHARKVEFVHPIKKESIMMEASLPDQKYWNIFNKK